MMVITANLRFICYLLLQMTLDSYRGMVDGGKLHDGHVFFDSQMLFSFLKMSDGLLGDDTNVIVEVRGRNI